ncbi:MAG: hypothetical protein COB07_01440 [Sulfurovum sp.]|nr:MAG: hypothetical protein COB07_01440 [Sulfurovum sp.]
MRNEEIDISIVTYNSKKWMDTFFGSLIKQVYSSKKLHIYITDNSSTDDTYSYLKVLKQKYASTFASFTLKQQRNLGFGHGHNSNFKQCKSQFVLVTNIDLEFEADAIEKIVTYALKDENNVASWEMRQKPHEHPKYYNPVTLETTWSSSACILFRREAIDKIGGYEKRIFMYGEDVELSYRLRDNGYKLKYYPKAVCWHYTYEEENEVKPIQFLGSTLANVYIRLRYGTVKDILKGYFLYLRLLLKPEQFPSQRKKLFYSWFTLLKNTPYFLFTRRKNKENQYSFYNWDYEFIRDGAFYEYKQENKEQALPLVSIIVRTCCKKTEYLKETIASIQNQTYENIEVIIVEDGTSDAETYIKSIDNLTIKYRSIEKSGRCKAGNIALSMTTGEYIGFLDDDDLFFADHIEVLTEELLNKQNIAAAYTSAFEVQTEEKSKSPLDYVEKAFNIIHRQEFSRCLMWHHNYIPIQSILFSRKLYEQYGGLDEELENLEDWNLWTRYSLKNDFVYIPKTTSLYRVPYHHQISAERQKELDSYYSIAVDKQKHLKIELTPIDVVHCYTELNQNLQVFSISRSGIRRVLNKIPFAHRFYLFNQKVYNKIFTK